MRGKSASATCFARFHFSLKDTMSMKISAGKAAVALMGLAMVFGSVQARQIGGSAGYWVGYATFQNGSSIGAGPYDSATACNTGLQAAIADKVALGYVVASVQGCKYVPGISPGTGNPKDSTE